MSPSAAAERTDRATDRRWEEALDEHRVALAAYLDTAEGVGDEAWTRPWAPGKWTPAEITEHLTLSYEIVISELETGRGMAMKTSGWRLRLLRWLLLPHILFHRSLPLKARAPREVRPAAVRAPRPEALRHLQARAEAFEQRFERALREGGGSLTHAYFGKLPPLKGIRFVAIHIEHHRRQVAKAK